MECSNMFPSKSQDNLDFSGSQQLQDSKRTELSPPPPGLPPFLHVTLNSAPTRVQTPNRWRFSSKVKMRLPQLPAAGLVPQVCPLPLARPPLFFRTYLCHLLSAKETKLPTSFCSRLSVYLHQSTSLRVAAVVLAPLTSPCPFKCVWQDPSVAGSSNNGEQTDRKTDRQRRRLPRGCLTLRPPRVHSLL